MKNIISQMSTLEKISIISALIIVLMVGYDLIMTSFFNTTGIDSQTFVPHMVALITLCGISTFFGFISVLFDKNN